MFAVIFLCVFVFGTIVGSFLNVALLRKNTGKSIVWEPSHCFSCGERLGPKDLVPIFSFLFFRGKCSYCGSKISLQYPIVEFLTGGLFLLVSNKIPVFNFLSFVFYASSFSALFLIVAYDFKQKIIDSNFFEIFTVFAITEAVLRWLLNVGDWSLNKNRLWIKRSRSVLSKKTRLFSTPRLYMW